MAVGDDQLKWWRRRVGERAYVYVLRDDREGPIKIGRAVNPPERISTLQTGYPYKLELAFVMPGDHELEWQLHQQFAETRLCGEWFEATPDTLDFIDRLAGFMKVAYSGVGNAPDFRRFDADWIDRNQPGHPVTVRFVAPNPVTGDELAERKRHHLAAGFTPRTDS